MIGKKQVLKMIASSVMLALLVGVVLISRKQTLLAHKKALAFDAVINLNLPVNQFGGVISRNEQGIAHAKIEQIALNCPKTEGSSEKIVRYGQLVYYPEAQATILICHGFMCDKFDVGFLRHMFPQGKYNFMTFDFRGHGENCEDQMCTFGRDESLDVITAAHFIKNHPYLKDKPIIVYGFSMGAVASIEAQARDHSLFSAMILDCPFDSSENIIKKSLESLQFTFLGYDFTIPACSLLQKYAFHPYVQNLIKNILKTVSTLDTKNVDVMMYPISPAESIKTIQVPCFFIHCKNDEKISVDAIKNIYAASGSPYKQLWLTNGRRHFDSYFYNPEKYIKEIRGFIETVVSSSRKPHKDQIVEDADELLAKI